MKIKTIFIIAIISISCTDRQLKLSSIEYLDFNWSTYDAKTDNAYVPLFFKSRLYAHIDKSGKTRIFGYDNQFQPRVNYFQGQMDKAFIQEILSFSIKIDPRETDSLYARYLQPTEFPRVSSQGSFLKVKVIFDNQEYKMFHFVNDEYSFIKYPLLLKIKKEISKVVSKGDTLNSSKEVFDKIKFNFLKEALVSDTSFNVPYEIPLRILTNDTIVNLSDFKYN